MNKRKLFFNAAIFHVTTQQQIRKKYSPLKLITNNNHTKRIQFFPMEITVLLADECADDFTSTFNGKLCYEPSGE